MRFQTPVWLWMLLVVAGLVGGYVLQQLRRPRFAARFTNVPLLASVVPKRPGWRRHTPTGKSERFHRTLADEWAYAAVYASDAERAAAYPAWLHRYNHHRGHTALGGQPPASRVTNLSGQYN